MVEALAAALAALPLAEAMRTARWGYATASGGHVFGLGLLVGAIVPLDLRLLGVWPSIPLAALARALVPVAATGLGLAATTGALLLLAAPADYLGSPVFLVKLGLVAAGTIAALALHLGPGLGCAGPARLRLAGVMSLACWLPALGLGRALAFLD